MEEVYIRQALESDAGDILAIYAPYIRDTPVTFETEVPDIGEFAQRIRNISAEYPFLVCVTGGKTCGYAYAHRFRERAAYRWSAELSVYIDPAHHRLGIGSALYAAVISILGMQNVQNVYGGVTVPNAGSEKLHESFGFRMIGCYHSTGFKLGSWHDVALFELMIGSHDPNPKEFLPVSQLDKETITGILRRHVPPALQR